MDKIFNPSLLISVGASSKKTLSYAKDFLKSMPENLLEAIDFYELETIDKAPMDIQNIVDSRLLAAKSLNALVDMGYKIRSENINAVRLNIYIFWQLYENSLDVLNLVKLLIELNYGNIDKAQHSGVSIYVLPILDKEWSMERNEYIEAIERLRRLKEFLSEKEVMLRIDSKIYLFHSIAKDGTRIAKEELLYISAFMAYLNVIPSSEPTFSSYSRKVLMHEGNYKLGTVGVSALTIFKESLRKEFSLYMAERVIEQCLKHERRIGIKQYDHLKFMESGTEAQLIKERLGCIAEDGTLNFREIDEDLKVVKKISEYPEALVIWKNEVIDRYISELKEKIKSEAEENIKNKIKRLNEELQVIILNYSLKEGIGYLKEGLKHIRAKKHKKSTTEQQNLLYLSDELKHAIEEAEKKSNFIIKGTIFSAVLIVILAAIFPMLGYTGRVIGILLYVILSAIIPCIYYKYKINCIHDLAKEYKKEILRAEGSSISDFTEECILKEYESLTDHILEKETLLENYAELLSCIGEKLTVEEKDVKKTNGNLITELLTNEDKERLFNEMTTAYKEIYESFIVSLSLQEVPTEELLTEKLLDICSKDAGKLGYESFYEYVQFKYSYRGDIELREWINKALVKSMQLLQYVNTPLEEEYLTLVAPPRCLKLLKEEEYNKSCKINFSSASQAGNMECVALVRICLGIDIDNIAAGNKRSIA